MQVVALVPCLLVAAAGMVHWYPASPRTRLFALPCFLLLVAINAEDLCNLLIRTAPHRRLATPAVWLITIALGCGAVWKQVREHRNLPDEDFAGAVQYLRQRVMPSDLLLVHPSVI
jgi:hypothetical protein